MTSISRQFIFSRSINRLTTTITFFFLPQPGDPSNVSVLGPDSSTVFPPTQVSGLARASARCWDTRTGAGAPQRRGPTRAWPVDRICLLSPRQLHFPGTPGGKTTTRPTCLKPTACKACMKKSNTRSLITFLSVPPHRPEYRKRMRSPSRSTQTLKAPEKKGICLSTVQFFDLN